MKSDYTHITLILDRSGSMASIRNDVVGGVNTFLEGQRGMPGECTLTVVQFDTANPYEVLHDFKLLRDVPAMRKEDFVPRGGTPLYDALGQGIVDLGERLVRIAEADRPSKVVFVTMTDGMENSSREYSRERVAEMTRHQRQKYNWQFVYLGADQDAMRVAADMGLDARRSSPYSKANFSKAMDASSRKIAMFRKSGKASDLDFSAEERKELTEEKRSDP